MRDRERDRTGAAWAEPPSDSVTEVRDAVRGPRWGTVLDRVRQDLRYGLRTLGRSRLFTAAAGATLAFTIAASTTVLSVVEQVLLRPLPYRDAARLFLITEADRTGNYRAASYQTFLDWQRDVRTLSHLGFVRGRMAPLQTPEGTERVAFGAVTPGFFELLGVRPWLGRTFAPGEERGDGSDVGVISYEFWQSHFGGDRSAVGQTLVYDSTTVRIVGVLPPGANAFFPEVAIWRPLVGQLAKDPALANRNFHVDSRVVGRLRPGASVESAAAEFRVLQSRLAAMYPAESAGWVAATLFPMREIIIGDVQSMLFLLGGAVLVLLLIGCANIANLSLVRALSRQREMAVRQAIGATSGRLAQQLLTESALLGLLGGSAGIVLAMWSIRAVRASAPRELPRASELVVDSRLVAIGLGLSLLAIALVSVRPALRARASNLVDALRQGRQDSAGAAVAYFRHLIAVAQVALATALVICGHLLIDSLRRLEQVDTGFDPRGVIAFRLHPPSDYETADEPAALADRVFRAIDATPGVASVALVNHLPGRRGVPTRIVVPGRDEASSSTDVASYRSVSAEYFRTMRIRLLRGRLFTDADMKAAGDGIVISESVANRYWPGRDPIGAPITIFGASQFRPDYGQPQPSHVIGVVADARILGPAGVESNVDVYVPYTRAKWPGAAVVVRAVGEPKTLIPSLRRAVRSVDPDIPVAGSTLSGGFALLDESLAEGLSTRKYVTWLVSLFAASGLLLALFGVYAVIAYGVTQRTQELGVRLALGARPRNLFSLVLGQGAAIGMVGVGAGGVAAFMMARTLTSFLYATAPTDPAAVIQASVGVMTIVLIACAVPARRASRLDPLVALREG